MLISCLFERREKSIYMPKGLLSHPRPLPALKMTKPKKYKTTLLFISLHYNYTHILILVQQAPQQIQQ